MNVRLVVRSHRFEVASAAVMAAFTFLVGGGLITRLVAYDLPLQCFHDGGGICQARQADVEAYGMLARNGGEPAMLLIALLPAVLGILLGIAVVAKEVELGSATFAWSVGPSRRRWLALRVVPFAVAILIAGLVAGGLGDWIEALQNPGSDAYRTYGHLGLRGPAIAAEGLAFFGVALVTGAVIGRILPALLMACVLVIAVGVGVQLLADDQLKGDTVLRYGMDGGIPGRVVDYLIQVPTGEVMRLQDAYDRYGGLLDEAMMVEGGTSEFRTVLRINPPEIYPLVVARLAVLFSALGLVAIVLSFAVVERRRP